MILHTLNKAQSAITLNQQLSNACSHHDSVVLIEDGVYQALVLDSASTLKSEHWSEVVKHIYILAADAEARGISTAKLSNTGLDYTFVTYLEFVDLCASHSNTISWY